VTKPTVSASAPVAHLSVMIVTHFSLSDTPSMNLY
jgi:hypothetical protein